MAATRDNYGGLAAGSGSTDAPGAQWPGNAAAAAARSVTQAFGHRVAGLPFTHLGAPARPRPRAGLLRPWHYWWQAHYLDCLLDAALRERGSPLPQRTGTGNLRLARQLLRGIWCRNGLRYRNSYYDDMAWLALATERLGRFSRPAGRAAARADEVLHPQLVSAHTPEFGGGLFWNTRRDFKNTPATAPAALYFARTGESARAQELLDWLHQRLLDQPTGLYLDGIRRADGAEKLVRAVYTYNQGTVLGALLAMGGPENMDRASRLIGSVATHLTHNGGVLHSHGRGPYAGGDGSLFTGILARYLALAAGSPELPGSARQTAQELVTATAESLWSRHCRTGSGQGQQLVFPSTTGPQSGSVPAAPDVPVSAPALELAGQLQAWMIFEAAHRAATGQPGPDQP
jgi:predicted alpha-1,6-mannanase (GH76 family)